MTQPPPLPDGDQLPSIEVMADLLAGAFPDDARQEARRILTERVLSHALSGLPDHPSPRALAEVVYGKLATRLGESDDPVATLRNLAVEEEIRGLSRQSLTLAITRYANDHSEAEDTARQWLGDAADRLLSMSVEDIAEEATRGLRELDRIEVRAQEYPDVWEGRRVEMGHARLNFQSARSGAFGTSAGALRDFLMELGEDPQDFDIH